MYATVVTVTSNFSHWAPTPTFFWLRAWTPLKDWLWFTSGENQFGEPPLPKKTVVILIFNFLYVSNQNINEEVFVNYLSLFIIPSVFDFVIFKSNLERHSKGRQDCRTRRAAPKTSLRSECQEWLQRARKRKHKVCFLIALNKFKLNLFKRNVKFYFISYNFVANKYFSWQLQNLRIWLDGLRKRFKVSKFGLNYFISQNMKVRLRNEQMARNWLRWGSSR